MADFNVESEFKRLDKNIQEKKIPFDALMELTYRCNINCVHCYCVEEKGRQELSLKEIEDLLGQLADEGCLSLTFSGGETLMRGDFFDILKAAQGMHFLMRIFTNGSMMTPAIADKIARYSPVEVELSLYGLTAETHERVTQKKGSFRNTYNAIALLKERGLDVSIKWVMMKHTLAEHEKLVEFAQSLGVAYKVDPVLFPRNDKSRIPLDQRLNDDELVSAYKLLGSLAVKEKVPNIVSAQKLICGAGNDSCCISPYGDIYPCVQFLLKFGNIRENNFSEIWYNSEAAKNWRKIKSFADLRGCNSCDMLGDCPRCPGLADLEDGDYMGVSREACRLTRAKACARKELYRGG